MPWLPPTSWRDIFRVLKGSKVRARPWWAVFNFPNRLRPLPFGYILQHTDALFGHSGLQDGMTCGYEHFYTCNVSLPRILVEKESFDPMFKGAAAEDMDLGYRLQKCGVRIYYSAACRCLHQHRISPSEFCRINEVRGHWAALFFYKHPDLEKRPQLTANILARWKREVRGGKENAEKALGYIRRVEEETSNSPPPKRILPRKAKEILPYVNFLHHYQYRRGLVGSPFITQMISDQKVSYDIDKQRDLVL